MPRRLEAYVGEDRFRSLAVPEHGICYFVSTRRWRRR